MSRAGIIGAPIGGAVTVSQPELDVLDRVDTLAGFHDHLEFFLSEARRAAAAALRADPDAGTGTRRVERAREAAALLLLALNRMDAKGREVGS